MEKRIIGILGDKESFTGKVAEVNIKSRDGRKYAEVLFSQVKFKNSGKKESHFWARMDETICKHKGKRIRANGTISMYGGKGRTSGTTLKNIKVIEIF